MSSKDLNQIAKEFLQGSNHVDESPFTMYLDLQEKEVLIKNVPHLTYTEGDIDDSFIAGDVERKIIKFLKQMRSEDSSVILDDKSIEYKDMLNLISE